MCVCVCMYILYIYMYMYMSVVEGLCVCRGIYRLSTSSAFEQLYVYVLVLLQRCIRHHTSAYVSIRQHTRE